MCYAFLILTPMIEVRCSLPLILPFGTLYFSVGRTVTDTGTTEQLKKKLSHVMFMQVDVQAKFSLSLNI